MTLMMIDLCSRHSGGGRLSEKSVDGPQAHPSKVVKSGLKNKTLKPAGNALKNGLDGASTEAATPASAATQRQLARVSGAWLSPSRRRRSTLALARLRRYVAPCLKKTK
eukprot:gnl/TRDRNA2_/TRDRNA2_161099_c0_seq2.p2 gnl/TRDRNA2_/TRDRNA2_161099_c0~~gnl/TRDRNA2_/TRDRNA2_161099_c0_seq2.p2  ORF type:complete len:109 (+),score=20.94 gnl/TRDRNA2_/TRDRNA2_161099_c0_seq2:411-737(+)